MYVFNSITDPPGLSETHLTATLFLLPVFHSEWERQRHDTGGLRHCRPMTHTCIVNLCHSFGFEILEMIAQYCTCTISIWRTKPEVVTL